MVKGELAIRYRYLSLRLDRRVPLTVGILLVVTLLAMAIHVGWGEYYIPPVEVIKTLVGSGQEPDYAFIIYTLRLPRTLVAYFAGIGLAISGTILQGLTRNPLADPGIIGINSGASLAAVSLFVLFPSVPLFWLPLCAFLGGLLVSLLIYLLAWDGGSSPIRLILMGIGLGAIAGSLTTLMMTFGNIYDVSQALFWLSGSVYGRSWEHLQILLPWIAVLAPTSWMMAQRLNILHLGDDLATGLGSQVELQRGWLLLISVALAAASVSATGTIGFIGLIAPHLGRQLVGATHEGLIITAAMLGGAIVVLADLLGQILFSPIELPCGVVTAIIGAPYFLYLLIKNR
ncbi:FecCD family ABC transporter permease [Merismopedia glauca]|uniref:Iron ABC transporter permease n=1 Tax=Merismopedia glauca CCAP 1448/3 TaxID=1296344 RepID=A0A2T1C0G0_9CYAN|nr:iron ABC transporter permease [Merismopedia glauca]PSB01750.1 iron ABC transporter permease [Merismopedia glauca CCAP 1448/3]